MPTYQVDIEKSTFNSAGNTVFWTNVYHVQAADQATAVTRGNSIVTIEKTIHSVNVNYTKMRVRNVLEDGMSGTIVPLTGTGGRTTPADYLPMYCTVRVDFSKATGRPNRKYLRTFIGEADQQNGTLLATYQTFITTNFTSPIVALGYVCDEAGRVVTVGATQNLVQMRQMRRGSKRKVTPVI
jgi:hypothetical protein